jgi:hypothetical protein
MRLVFSFSFLFALAACGHSHGEEYDNLPDCVVDHVDEGLSESNSITTCLLDHLEVTLTTQAECEAYVSDPANGGYTASATQACTDYFAQM